jgi:arginyl-tRNA--protein-N-Asp/Glu arginylyltransferase
VEAERARRRTDDMERCIKLEEAITPGELDRYLREGWYRMGTRMITCRFISIDEGAVAVLWSRTRLQDYQFSRSNRRLMRANRCRYSVREGPLSLDAEHEALYQRYLEVAPGKRPPTLSQSLQGDQTEAHFDTRELAMRDEHGQLVAFSAFDLGGESLQSVMGVYDPAHKKASLGYWSLLLEVEHAIELGLRYHYAGYVLAQGGTMNYKLRVGQIEFLDKDDGLWRQWSERDTVDDPGQLLDRMLTQLRDALREHDTPSRIQNYRWFEARAASGVEALFEAPRVVVLGADAEDAITLLTWSFESKRYELVLCTPARVASASADGEHDEVEMWVTHDRVALGDDAPTVAARVAQWWRSPGRIVRSREAR